MATFKQYSITDDFSNGFAPLKFEKEIAASDINIEYSYHISDGVSVTFHFGVEIDSTNEDRLDTLVANHEGFELIRKERKVILHDILSNVSSQEQLGRLMAALDVSATLIAALDNYNYSLARARVDALVTSEALTDADRTLAFTYIPEE